MVKRIPTFLSLAVVASAWSQMPDVSIVTDFRMNITSSSGNEPRLRLVDPLARYSTITLQTLLENGMVAKLSQRFSKIPGDNSSSILEFAYIEAPGLWQIGHVPLPFGQNSFVRDYGLGGVIQTQLVIDAIPIRVGSVDNGKRRTRGASLRVGDRIGLSYASGDHFAASGTSLAMTRDIEKAPGIGHGYHTLLGADTAWSSGLFKGSVEFVSMRSPHTAEDPREDYIDVMVRYAPTYSLTNIGVGFTRGLLQKENFARIDSSIQLHQKAAATLVVIFRPDRTVFSSGLRIRF